MKWLALIWFALQIAVCFLCANAGSALDGATDAAVILSLISGAVLAQLCVRLTEGSSARNAFVRIALALIGWCIIAGAVIIVQDKNISAWMSEQVLLTNLSFNYFMQALPFTVWISMSCLQLLLARLSLRPKSTVDPLQSEASCTQSKGVIILLQSWRYTLLASLIVFAGAVIVGYPMLIILNARLLFAGVVLLFAAVVFYLFRNKLASLVEPKFSQQLSLMHNERVIFNAPIITIKSYELRLFKPKGFGMLLSLHKLAEVF